MAPLSISALPTTVPTLSVDAAEACRLILSDAAPAGMRVKGHLNLKHLINLTSLPAGLCADSIDINECWGLTELPAGTGARRIDASGCRALRQLPAGLHCYELNLSRTPIIPSRRHDSFENAIAEDLIQLQMGHVDVADVAAAGLVRAGSWL